MANAQHIDQVPPHSPCSKHMGLLVFRRYAGHPWAFALAVPSAWNALSPGICGLVLSLPSDASVQASSSQRLFLTAPSHLITLSTLFPALSSLASTYRHLTSHLPALATMQAT